MQQLNKCQKKVVHLERAVEELEEFKELATKTGHANERSDATLDSELSQPLAKRCRCSVEGTVIAIIILTGKHA